jgi:hypothetical protein
MSKWIKPPGGNRIYLHCECGQAIELARRSGNLYLESKSSKYHFDQWLTDHEKCSANPDHFKLAHDFQPNHDVAPAADPVSNAVRLALVKS